ncbi:MAG: hypothetical protein WCW78_00455 [Candidatus Paceibacterota bacterium]
MFKGATGISFKKGIYIFLTVLLVEMCGFIIHELVSMEVLAMLIKNGMTVPYFHIAGFFYSPLPPYVFLILFLIGIFGGIFLALHWWRMVYIEHRHWLNWYRHY